MVSLVDVANTGNRLETLKELRQLLAKRLDESCTDRDMASLSRRLMQCCSEIEKLESESDQNRDNALQRVRDKISGRH